MSDVGFEESEDYTITFGKYKSSSIGDVADTDILYLVWLKGEMSKKHIRHKDSYQYQLYAHLRRYLADPDVRDEITRVRGLRNAASN